MGESKEERGEGRIEHKEHNKKKKMKCAQIKDENVLISTSTTTTTMITLKERKGIQGGGR